MLFFVEFFKKAGQKRKRGLYFKTTVYLTEQLVGRNLSILHELGHDDLFSDLRL
jgi:hypothetical protein